MILPVESVPSDWEFLPLGEVARVYSGGTPSRSVPAYWRGTVPWVTTGEIEAGRIRSTREMITDAGLKASAARIAPPGTLLLAMYGQGKTRGKVAQLEIAAAMNQACAAIESNDLLDPRYLLHYLTWQYESIRTMSNSGSQDNLSGEIVRRIPIAVPGMPEQRAICESIDDASRSAELLELLIIKKQEIKQGMMQRLLTGRSRLTGFAGLWKTTTVGAVADVKTGPFGSALHERDYVAQGTPIITVEHLGEYGINCVDVPMVSDVDRRRLKAYMLMEGDIVFSRVGSIDRNARVSQRESGWLFSGRLLRVRPDSAVADSRFLSAQFHSKRFREFVKAVAVGQTMPSLNTSILKGIEIALPPVDEQQAIGEIAERLDQEFFRLKKKLEKARDIKQGMMQQLFTGRTRLPF